MSAIIGETLNFGQQNGDDVSLVVYGDEFYARYETVTGYSTVYDVKQGCYCYVELDAGGAFRSTGTPITKLPPEGLLRHLKEAPKVRNHKFSSSYAALRPAEPEMESHVLRTLGEASGLLTGRQVNVGQVKGLTILVEFKDIHAGVNAAEVDAMLNQHDYQRHGNHCSVRDYYRLMSNQRLDYTNRVVGPVRLSQKQSYYINRPLMQEALELAIEQFGVQLAEFDSLNEGVVDALSFMYAGRTLYKNWLWPHNSVLDFSHNSIRTHYYTVQSLGRTAVDLSIGTFTHESGHMLCRFPDLYDYGQRDGDFERSSGLGRYCLMSSGNHLNGGKTPSPISAYLRHLAQWPMQRVDLSQASDYKIRHADYHTVYQYPTPIPNEYFLVENRLQLGLDTFLPDSGLAIYHCDTRGSNEYQSGTPEKHYQCALLQADGKRDLEFDINPGDQGDLYDYHPGFALDDTTRPHSRLWSGADSGFVLKDIEVDNDAISFITGTKVTDPDGIATFKKEVVADLIIPDDDVIGISSVIDVEPIGIARSLTVSVEITHPYRGDLFIQLISPYGDIAVLHRKAHDQEDNLSLRLSADHFPELKQFIGQPIEGCWQLSVTDMWAKDVGRLDRWSLALAYEVTTRHVAKSADPNLTIPDNDRTGVESTISLDTEGEVHAIAAQVDISHTYRGDLQVELIAPNGETALLAAADGRSGRNLTKQYTAENSRAITALNGSQAEGDWRLHVRDLAGYDEGVLKHWELEVEVTEG